jgi:hypothetical protein
MLFKSPDIVSPGTNFHVPKSASKKASLTMKH